MSGAPPSGPIVINAPSGGGSGGGSSSGGSSGGSSSAPAPHVDPIVQERISMFQSIYTGLWGEPATEAYLKKAANSGMNKWEFEEHEMHKPAFARTQTYKDSVGNLVAMLKSMEIA